MQQPAVACAFDVNSYTLTGCFVFAVCLDPDPARRATAAKLGADLIVDPSEPGFQEKIQDFCGGPEAAVR